MGELYVGRQRMKILISITLLFLAATSLQASYSQSERDEFVREAEEVLRSGTFTVSLIPPSTGPMNESVVKVFSLFGRPSRLVKSALKTLRECEKRKLNLAVACASEGKGRKRGQPVNIWKRGQPVNICIDILL